MSTMTTNVSTYEIKLAKTGHKIPVVNDVLLHSVYDPISEADKFVEQNYRGPQQKNYLIFGLGFGYHIAALQRKLQSERVQAKIVVVEPNPNVTLDCLELNLINQDDIYLVINQAPAAIYSNRDLTRFLLMKPQVVSHSPSFNLYSDYFKSVLSFEASTAKEDISNALESPTLRNYFNELEGETYESVVANLQGNSSFTNELDTLVLALEQITQKSEQLTNG
jgi:hypothetical protein